MILPLGGWSSVDKRGSYFHDGEADRIFIDEFKRQLKQKIEIREVDTDLDTPEFARVVVEAFGEIMQLSRT